VICCTLNPAFVLTATSPEPPPSKSMSEIRPSIGPTVVLDEFKEIVLPPVLLNIGRPLAVFSQPP